MIQGASLQACETQNRSLRRSSRCKALWAKPNTVRLSATRVSVISCVSRKPGFHGGSDHDAARTLFGCDTGPGEYSGSAGGFEQGCPTGGHGTGTVGDRHVRATILQTVAPSDAL